MIKLYNKTKYADQPIRDILNYAQKRMKVTGEIIVKVTRSQHGIHGTAYQGRPYLWHLTKTKCRETDQYKLMGKEIGYYEISLPYYFHPAWKDHDITTAENFLKVALHETAHIKDYRAGEYFPVERTAAGRRIAHDKRQVELSAENHIYHHNNARSKADRDRETELILNLAIELEAKHKEGQK